MLGLTCFEIVKAFGPMIGFFARYVLDEILSNQASKVAGFLDQTVVVN